MNRESAIRRNNDDVEFLRRNARFVLEISSHNEVIVKPNINGWRLNVIAVVGPAHNESLDISLDEALLFELGIGKTRPYHDACNKNGWLHKRKNFFTFYLSQYYAVRPALFKIVKDLTVARIGLWKNKTWTIKTKKIYYSRHQRTLFRGYEYPDCTPGVRFSVAKNDLFFLSDVLKLENYFNPIMQEKLRGVAKFIDMLWGDDSAGYRKYKYSRKEMNNMLISPTSAMKAVVESLDNPSFKDHHLHFLLTSGLVKKDLLLRNTLVFLHGEQIKKKITEIGRAMKQTELRENYGLQVRVIPENHKPRDFVVFEVAIPDNEEAG